MEDYCISETASYRIRSTKRETIVDPAASEIAWVRYRMGVTKRVGPKDGVSP